MPAIPVGTGGTLLDGGSTGYLRLRNEGVQQAIVTWGASSQILWPSCATIVTPQGMAVSARTVAGSTVIDVTGGRFDAGLTGAGMIAGDDLADDVLLAVPAMGQQAAALMQRLTIGSEGAAVVVIGDSTGLVGTVPWPLRMARWLAARFPRYTVNFRWFQHDVQGYEPLGTGRSHVVQAGTGGVVLDFYDASVSGANVTYPTGTAARWAAMLPVEPQLVITSIGHNNMGDDAGFRYTYYPLVRALTQTYPRAGVLLTAQNPRGTSDPERASDLARARTVTDLAASDGLGLVNVTRAFLDVPQYDTLLTDGLHPTNAGVDLWWETLLPHLLAGARTQPRHGPARATSLWIPASAMAAYAGTPTLAVVNSQCQMWTLAETGTTELVTPPFVTPEHWKSADVFAYWCTPFASPSAVKFGMQRRWMGGQVTTVDADASVSSTGVWIDPLGGVPRTGSVLGVAYATHVTGLGGYGDQTNYPTALRIARYGSDAGDTLPSLAYLLGVRLERAA